MSIYKIMYLHLFNAVSDALAFLPENHVQAEHILKDAQIKCEELFLDDENSPQD